MRTRTTVKLASAQCNPSLPAVKSTILHKIGPRVLHHSAIHYSSKQEESGSKDFSHFQLGELLEYLCLA